MCGRFTVKVTLAELVALHRLTMEAPPHNLRPRYNGCPTDPVDVVTAGEGVVGLRSTAATRWRCHRADGRSRSQRTRWFRLLSAGGGRPGCAKIE